MRRAGLSSTTVAAGPGKYSGEVVVDTDAAIRPDGDGDVRWVVKDYNTDGCPGLTIARYSGGWEEGARHGPGAWRSSTGASYTGEYVCEQRCGEGTAKFQAGATITATFVDGLPHGNGVAVSSTAKYTGGFAHGKWHGKGRVEYPDGSVFTGSFAEGLREGKGRFEWADGEVYEGDFTRDLRNGAGVYTWPDGRRYEGEFANDQRHGKGKLTFGDGSWFEGEYRQGQRAGEGTMQYVDGKADRGEWRGNMLVRLGAAPSEAGGEVVSNGPLTHAGSQYLDAVKRNDSVAIRTALHGGSTFVDLADEEGKTALYHAVTLGFVDKVQLFLSLGARPNHLTRAGNSILRDAYALLPSVAEHPVHRGPINPAAFSPTERNVRAAITILMASGATPNADFNPTAEHKSVLWTAIASSDTDMVAQLIARGVDVNIAGTDGETPLHVAVRQLARYSELVRLLDIWRRTAKLKPMLFTEVDESKERFQAPRFRRRSQVQLGGCALGMAAVGIVQALLNAGAVAESVVKGRGTALHAAARIRGTLFDTQVICKLAEKCPDLNCQADGDTALFFALAARNYGLALRLVALGADPNVRLGDGTVALCAVVAAVPLNEGEKGELQRVLMALIEAGADPLAELMLEKEGKAELVVANVVDYAAMAQLRRRLPVSIAKGIAPHAMTRPQLPEACALSAKEIAQYEAEFLAILVEAMRLANKARKAKVPMCFECGLRHGFGKINFALQKWGELYFCSEQCKMRKQNRSRTTAVVWRPSGKQAVGLGKPAIISARLKSAGTSRSAAETEGSTVYAMPLK